MQHATTHTATFGYDTAGRLVTATIPGHQLTYQFAATGGCGTNTAAGASGNRTGLTDLYTAPGQSSITTSTAYCYDWADRLTTSTVTGANIVADGITPAEIGYDARGNVTRLGFRGCALRHFAASTWLRLGTPVDKVAEYLGDDPRTVRAVYAHVLGEDQRRAHLRRIAAAETQKAAGVTWGSPGARTHHLYERVPGASEAKTPV